MTPRLPPPIRFGEISLKTGVRLRFAEQGDATGMPVILLHGYSDSWFSFSRALPFLPATLRVFALDMRGHGDSDRPASGYTMRDLAEDVIAFMDAKDLLDVTVCGHSMGSFVAQQVALHAPEHVRRMVLIGSATTPRRIIGMAQLDAAVQELTDPVSATFIEEFQRSTVHDPVPEEFMARVVAESLKLPARVWRSLMAGMLATDPVAGLNGHPIPALILWGEHESIMPRSEQDALLAMLPRADLMIYQDTGHTPHWERPGAFARDLQDFMDRTA